MRPHNVMSRSYVFPQRELPLGVKIIDDQGEYDFHRHEDYGELVIVTGGHALHVVGNMKYPIGPGDVFMILGEREHAYCHVDNLVLYNVLFDGGKLQLPFYDLSSCPGYQVLFTIDPKSTMDDRFDNRFRLDYRQLCRAKELAEELNRRLGGGEPGYRFYAVNAFQELLGFLVEAYSDNCNARHLQSVPHRLGALAGFMEEHYAEMLTVETMCRRTNMSRSNLFRQFRLYLKNTPIEHLLDIRLRHAKELLIHTDLAVSEVALRCGFNDGNYFSRQFRTRCLTTPLRFRHDFHHS